MSEGIPVEPFVVIPGGIFKISSQKSSQWNSRTPREITAIASEEIFTGITESIFGGTPA